MTSIKLTIKDSATGEVKATETFKDVNALRNAFASTATDEYAESVLTDLERFGSATATYQNGSDTHEV